MHSKINILFSEQVFLIRNIKFEIMIYQEVGIFPGFVVFAERLLLLGNEPEEEQLLRLLSKARFGGMR